ADDSHTALTWKAGAFHGQPIGERAVSLRAADLLLRVDGRELALPGVTRADALAWLGAALGQSGALAAYPHLPPAHPVGGGAPFPAPDAGFAELARWFGNAADVLAPIAARRETGPIRVWPHHFDIATLLDLGGGRSVLAGLSPGDSSYAEPYFYVTPTPYPKERTGPPLLSIPGAHWHIEGWFGAVLPGSDLRDASHAEVFLAAAIFACEE